MFKNVLFIEKNLVYKNTNIKIKCVNINNLIVIIKSPKQRLETYCFCSVSYYYYYSPFFLSVAHELVHGKSQELQDRIS